MGGIGTELIQCPSLSYVFFFLSINLYDCLLINIFNFFALQKSGPRLPLPHGAGP